MERLCRCGSQSCRENGMRANKSQLMKAATGLCVDVDSVKVHLVGYGITDSTDSTSVYDVALPRMLELFEKRGAKATFFFVSSEVQQRPGALKAVLEAGHEIACHSSTHPIPFTATNKQFYDREVVDAKKELEDAAGCAVLGFRAPSWAGSIPLVDAVGRAGYRYDSSAFPSWMMKLRGMLLERRAERSIAAEPVKKLSLQPTPYLVHLSGHEIVELPVSVTPFSGFPYYHTPRLMAPQPLFACVELMMKLRPSYLTYTFHAVDFLSTDEDRLDQRIKRHPGMMMMLKDKLAIADRALSALGSGRSIVPLRAIAETVR